MLDRPRVPSRFPAATALAILGSMVFAGLSFVVWYQSGLDTFERLYLPSYLKACFIPQFIGKATPRMVLMSGPFTVNDDNWDHYGAGAAWRRVSMTNRDYAQFLFVAIYRRQSLTRMLLLPSVLSGTFFLVAFGCALPFEVRRMRQRRDGIKIRGPEILSVEEYNRRSPQDGLWLEVR